MVLPDGRRKGNTDALAEATVLYNRVLHPPRHLQLLRFPLLGSLCYRSSLHYYFHAIWHSTCRVRYYHRWVQKRWTIDVLNLAICSHCILCVRIFYFFLYCFFLRALNNVILTYSLYFFVYLWNMFIYQTRIFVCWYKCGNYWV